MTNICGLISWACGRNWYSPSICSICSICNCPGLIPDSWQSPLKSDRTVLCCFQPLLRSSSNSLDELYHVKMKSWDFIPIEINIFVKRWKGESGRRDSLFLRLVHPICVVAYFHASHGRGKRMLISLRESRKL